MCGRSSALKAANIFRNQSLLFCVRGRRSISPPLETVRIPRWHALSYVYIKNMCVGVCECDGGRWLFGKNLEFAAAAAAANTTTMTAMTVKNVYTLLCTLYYIIRTYDLVQNNIIMMVIAAVFLQKICVFDQN